MDHHPTTVSKKQIPMASVIITMKDVAPYIVDCLTSIEAGSNINVEIICVDDGSTDDTWTIVESRKGPRVQLLHNQGTGIADAANTGLRQARGEYIFRCDADDLFANERIAAQIDWLEKHPAVAVVCGHHGFIREDGSPLIYASANGEERSIRDEIISGNAVHHCDCAYRADALSAIGGYRNFFETSEDLDLIFRLADQNDIWYSPDHVYQSRIRESSISRSQGAARRQWFTLKAQEFRKERNKTGSDILERGFAPEIPNKFPDDIPQGAARFELMLLIAAAWRELDKGRFGRAWGYYVTACFNPRYRKYRDARIFLRLPLVLLKRVMFS